MAPNDITRPDIRAVIRAVAPTHSSVRVPVAELYRVYSGHMSEQGREPVSANLFGRAMTECGQRAVQMTIDGRRVLGRLIREKSMASEEFDTEPARIRSSYFSPKGPFSGTP